MMGPAPGPLRAVSPLTIVNRWPPAKAGSSSLTNDTELAERIDFYTHLGHLQGQVHGVNYKLAGPLAAIGRRRLPRLHAQLEARRHNARRILDRLSPDGLLHELAYPDDSQPNYYQLVLATTARQHETAAKVPYQNKTATTRARRENHKQRTVKAKGYLNLELNYEHVAEFDYKPGKCTRSYKVVALRKNISRSKR